MELSDAPVVAASPTCRVVVVLFSHLRRAREASNSTKIMASLRPLTRGLLRPQGGPASHWAAVALSSTLLAASALLIVLSVVSLPASSSSGELRSGGELEMRGTPWREVISWKPRAFLFHNFVSKEECEYLIETAKPHMVKSRVIDSTTGKSKGSKARTSSGFFLERRQDKIVQAIEDRIAAYTFIPAENGEGLHVLHYEIGQKYEPHFDYFFDKFNQKRGGQRTATLIMYLSDVEEGGETVFPDAVGNASSLAWYDELSECGRRGIAIKPRMGDALLFWSMNPDATVDLLSVHGSCPVIRGDKWAATKWMHIYEFNY